MKRSVPSLALVLSLAAAWPVPAAHAASGLRCSLGEVVVENLKIGHRYSLRELANLPLTLTNSGSRSARVAIQPMVPDASELRMNSEPLPDAAWASVAPDTIALDPGQSGQAELTIAIPDDERLFGRRFQVMFWSHTLPDDADLIAVGLKSRVIFSVDTVRDERDAIPAGELGIELDAGELRLDRLGKRGARRLDEVWDKPWTVRNNSARPLEVELSAVEVPRGPDGADLLHVVVLRFDPAVVTLAPGESRELSGTVTPLPAKRPHGQRYVCAVAAAVTNLPVRTEIQSRVMAEAR